MPITSTSVEKIGTFVDRLQELGYKVRKVSSRPQVYSINDKRVNLRCRSKPQDKYGTRRFFYDVSFSIFDNVDNIVFLMTDHNYFYLIPPSFLQHLTNEMYPNSNNKGVGVFTINWDDETLELRDKAIPIGQFYKNLNGEEEFPVF